MKGQKYKDNLYTQYAQFWAYSQRMTHRCLHKGSQSRGTGFGGQYLQPGAFVEGVFIVLPEWSQLVESTTLHLFILMILLPPTFYDSPAISLNGNPASDFLHLLTLSLLLQKLPFHHLHKFRTLPLLNKKSMQEILDGNKQFYYCYQ